ncbi:sulfite exporter TauE/SafE family protein [Ascidiimonas sp. W6]|uniref:sulfite exporter TauE/SafE family protein n=1 Tax=Ascidiimonas meishanensis TaxID=3128903 RepID=UPI0030EBF504
MLITALLLGLLGSFHCIGMCGPIAFMLPVHKASNKDKLIRVGTYHLGRLISYALIGLLFGLLGRGIYLFGMQQKLSIAIGLMMIVLILLPVFSTKKFNLSGPLYGIISKMKSALGRELAKSRTDTFLSLGLLNGFLPCGLVYMAVMGAIASGDVWQGGLYMLLFGMGTIPMMTLAVFAAHRINTTTRKQLTKVIPIFVVVLGVLFILRGMGLGIPYLSPEPVVELVEATIECH